MARQANMSPLEHCRACLHKTPDQYCSHPRLQPPDGKQVLARHVWFTGHNSNADYCAGKFFEQRKA